MTCMQSLSPIETSAFLRFAPAYFMIMAEALFHDLPSVIAKMLGFFQIYIKNPMTGAEIKLDLLVMENLFYDRSPSRIFDLKGSMRNRKIQSTGEQNEVLLDENMVEYIYESPLFAREHSKKLLRASVWNDTLFLARQNVMDYSLMVAVDESKKELVVGIIDCIRTYTWDKKLESWIKDRGFAGGGRNRPTVTSPKEYKSRFREAMARQVALFSPPGLAYPDKPEQIYPPGAKLLAPIRRAAAHAGAEGALRDGRQGGVGYGWKRGAMAWNTAQHLLHQITGKASSRKATTFWNGWSTTTKGDWEFGRVIFLIWEQAHHELRIMN